MDIFGYQRILTEYFFMNDVIFSFFAFVITISFLVFIHEFGHFWVARKFGVKIEKFSVGFGKPIIKWHGKKDNTEYSLSWIPLGGYVKMYGEENDSDGLSLPQGSFAALSPIKRLLIAFAGPAVNLLFAIIALWALFIIGIPAFTPTIGSVNQNSHLADANISRGDTIRVINGHHIDSMTDATLALVDALGNPSVAVTAVSPTGVSKNAQIDISDYQPGSEMAVEKVAGFNWAIDDIIRNHPVLIAKVSKDSPADLAGLLPGDVILSINEQPAKNWENFASIIATHTHKPLSLSIQRFDQDLPITTTLTPQEHPKRPDIGYAGISASIDSTLFTPYRTTKRYGIGESLIKSVSANYLQGELMLKTLWRLAAGKASVENLGGPLSIADYSGKSLSAGYVTYFYFLASLSLVLAVMNLLPIPVLDGGHILICLIELVRKKPLSERSTALLMRIGGAVLMTFIIFVLTLDVWRYLFQ